MSSPQEKAIEVFTRLDVAYDQALTASVLAGRPDDPEAILDKAAFEELHEAVDLLKWMRDLLDPDQDRKDA